MKLDAGERNSPVWAKLTAYLEERLEVERERNDQTIHDAIATARIRGRIEQIKDFLSLGKE